MTSFRSVSLSGGSKKNQRFHSKREKRKKLHFDTRDNKTDELEEEEKNVLIIQKPVPVASFWKKNFLTRFFLP